MRNKSLKLIIVSMLSTLFLLSCSNDDKGELATTSKNEVEQAARNTAFAIRSVPQDAQVGTKGVGLRGKYWAPTQTIRIKFLDNGYDVAKNDVKQYAAEWTLYANVNFEYVATNEDADVKIAFNWLKDRSAWSVIGKDCLMTPQNQPSMNIPNLGTYYGADKTVVLREFGHVLGLVFEHQLASNNFSWNQNSVYTYFLQQGWSEEKIIKDIFTTYTTSRTNYTAYDAQSIMLLYFPPHLTVDGRETPWNTQLSAVDKSFIKQLYPGR